MAGLCPQEDFSNLLREAQPVFREGPDLGLGGGAWEEVKKP